MGLGFVAQAQLHQASLKFSRLFRSTLPRGSARDGKGRHGRSHRQWRPHARRRGGARVATAASES